MRHGGKEQNMGPDLDGDKVRSLGLWMWRRAGHEGKWKSFHTFILMGKMGSERNWVGRC